MTSLANSLPEAEKKELMLRRRYASLAAYLSIARFLSASELVRRVNEVLPELEMDDKRIRIAFQSLYNVEGARSGPSMNADLERLIQRIEPDAVGAIGWDRASLLVRHVPTASRQPQRGSNATEGVIFLLGATDHADGEGGADVHSWEAAEERGDGGGDGEKDAAIASLSSGEGARLALALETVCCEWANSDGPNRGSNLRAVKRFDRAPT